MQTIKWIWHYFSIEIKQEFRQKYATATLFMFVLSTSYLIYFSLEYQGEKEHLSPTLWIILLLITILFSNINISMRSFTKETDGNLLAYYFTFPPIVFITSKILANILLSLLLSILNVFIFIVIIGNPIIHTNIFILSLLIASIGFASTFTFISAIARKTNSGSTLSAILGFPVIIPMLSIFIRLFSESFNRQLSENFYNNLWLSISLNIIPLILSIILFPYIWRE